ncbi:MAG: tetratricopeptide repeat protein [Candidatus Palauibacterales bacterium]|nr:tetratricopeptide repeat protein [Candidatus Palauibacterales bacterium]MDP2483148.1 tetratricopeptide repeat protein [Candidatus Palauibacterales bacterium]
MSNLRSRLLPLYEEARRRRMFRVVIVYVLVGLATLEGAGNLVAALNLPVWIDTLVALLVLAGFPVAIVVGWFFDFTAAGFVRTDAVRESDPPRHVSSSESRSPVKTLTTGAAGHPAADRKSIAVLPFLDMSPDRSQEYLGDGIAEEIINALTRIEDLRVVARTSSFAFKGRNENARQIGAQLGVGSLLEGSVRTFGNMARITAQLIDCEKGYHLWSERYELELKDVFAIQDEVARAIVGTLKAKLGEDDESPIVKPGTGDMEAYNLYLRGRYHWNRRTAEELEKGIELFRQAIAIDDRYALAWAGLADSYSVLGWYRHLSSIEAYTKTVSAASSAVAVDDSLAEPYTSLAYARFMYGWDWAGAEAGFQAAIERNPSYAVARHWYGEFLMAMGRFTESVEQLETAHALDPLSPTIGFGVGWVQYFLGDYEAAIRRYEQTLEHDPQFALAPWFLGPALVEAGDYDRAIEVCKEWIPRVRRKNGLAALLAYAQARAGRRDEAIAGLRRLEELRVGKEVAPDHLALVHIGLGDLDSAFESLDVALRQRSWYLVFLRVDPAFEPLRGDPRFDHLVHEVGLDDLPALRTA